MASRVLSSSRTQLPTGGFSRGACSRRLLADQGAIGSFQVFGQVFVLTQGGPGDATRTVVQHLYETAFQNLFQFGAASAMAWVLFAFIAVFSALQFRLLRGHEEL